MTEFKRISALDAAKKLIDIEDSTVLIHVRPDGDAVGSGAALCIVLKLLGKSASILSADKIPDRLKFILENTGVTVAKSSVEGSTLSIDVASPAQLGALYDDAPRPSLMIDHHRVGEQYADGYIVPEASSAAEALYDIICELENMGKLKMNGELAYALYAAISSDTGCFAYSNTSSKTHMCAARLIELGVPAADINRKLFSSKSRDEIKAEGYVASSIETEFDGKVAYAIITAEKRNELGLSPEHFETAIDVVRTLLGAEIAFVIKENQPGIYKASLRSTGPDVASVAAKFGGGGHTRAAGCAIQSESADDTKDALLSEISNLYK